MKNKIKLNFGKSEKKDEFELEDEFTHESNYLGYDEKEDKVKSLGPVKRYVENNDEFDLTEYIKEEEEKAEKLPFEDSDDNHQNKAKPIIIISFVFCLFIVVIVTLVLLVFNKKDDNSNTNNEQSTNTSIKTEEEENIDNVNTDTKNMYGEGYFKVFNKNAKYYSIKDTATILQNANETVKEYFKLVKKMENDRIPSINRKQEIETLEAMIVKEYATLEESQKVFNRYEKGNDLYNCIYQRFTNVEKLLNSVKYLSPGNESINRINEYIKNENTLLETMTKLTIELAESNHLEYKKTDNEITIIE